MQDRTPRRRFLQLAGTGAVVSVAGCSALDQDAEDPENGDDDEGNGEQETAAEFVVTAAMDISDEDLIEAQQEIEQAVEDGELDEEEAQIRAQEVQVELIAEAVAAFESHAEGDDGLQVTEAAEEAGVVLVEGNAEALLDVLTLDEVAGILDEEQFDELQQPMQP